MKLGAMMYSFGTAIRGGQMTQRDAIGLCGELGLYSVDTVEGLGGDPWPDVRRMVEDASMFVACHITKGELTSPNDAERRKGMDAVRAGVDDAITLGADRLMVVTGLIHEGSDRAAAQGRIGEAFKALIEEIRGSNVRLCIEDFPGERSPHRTSQELLAVCRMAGPELAICFDTGNFYCGGETPEDAWPNLASRVIHCHAKDWAWAEDGRHSTPSGKRLNPELVGRGIIDYPNLLAQMKAADYAGVVSFEYEGPLNRAKAAREGLLYLRSILADIE